MEEKDGWGCGGVAKWRLVRNGSVDYFGCGGSCTKLPIMKLHRTIHTRTHMYKLCGLYECQVPGFDNVIQDV